MKHNSCDTSKFTAMITQSNLYIKDGKEKFELIGPPYVSDRRFFKIHSGIPIQTWSKSNIQDTHSGQIHQSNERTVKWYRPYQIERPNRPLPLDSPSPLGHTRKHSGASPVGILVSAWTALTVSFTVSLTVSIARLVLSAALPVPVAGSRPAALGWSGSARPDVVTWPRPRAAAALLASAVQVTPQFPGDWFQVHEIAKPTPGAFPAKKGDKRLQHFFSRKKACSEKRSYSQIVFTQPTA